MRNSLLLIILPLALVNSASAQPHPDTLWTRIYCEGHRTWGNDIQLTDDGGYIVAGFAQMELSAVYEGYLLKIDSAGNEVWSRTYGGAADEQLYSVQQTSDGGYIAAGCTESFGYQDGYYNFYLVKTNSVGDTLWTRAYGGSSIDRAYCVRQTDDGGYVFAGYSSFSGIADNNGVLFKIDAAGDSLWIRTYGGSGSETCYHVEQTSDGGYVLAGEISYGMSEGGGAWLIKTDSMGDTLWTKLPCGALEGTFQSVQQTNDGGYVGCGYTWNVGQPWDCDGYIVKMNALGDTTWVAVFDRTQWDYLYSVRQTFEGDYVAAGWVDFLPPVQGEVALVKADASGQLLWSRTYEGSGIVSYGTSVQQSADGGYVVAGYTGGSLEEGIPFCYVVKTGPDEASAVQPEPGSVIPTAFALHPPYPNPFNPATTISYDVPISGQVHIAVHNLLGQQVVTLVDGAIAPGSYSTVWDARSLPSGIYFVRLSAGNQQLTRKVLLLR